MVPFAMNNPEENPIPTSVTSDKPKPKGRKNRTGQASKQQREDNHRTKYGAPIQDARRRQLRESFQLDIPASDVAESAPTNSVPVTLRGIGLLTTLQFNSIQDSQAKIPENQRLTVFELFRTSLAQVELKLRFVQEAKVLSTYARPDTRRYISTLDEDCRSCISLDTYPTLAGYVNAIGTFTHDGSHFYPTIRKRDQSDPYSLTLSNLFETVTRLAVGGIAELPERRYFALRNPIPGARYDAQYRLLNPNDIMPGEVSVEQLEADFAKLRSALCRSSGQKDIATARERGTIGTIHNVPTGSSCQLVSVDGTNYDTPVVRQLIEPFIDICYATETRLTINTCQQRDFYTVTVLEEIQRDMGILFLFGETEGSENTHNPFLRLHSRGRCRFEAKKRFTANWKRLASATIM